MAEVATEPVVSIGEVIEGRYKILQLLGEGGTGTVFLAEHWLIKRRVALKILHREYAADADMIRRFMNEALAAGTLGHPNIVESTDMGFTKTDVPYIVFEYVEGTLLSEEIDRLTHLPIVRALAIVQQIASALRAAHEAGIVHRDLKAENVLLSKRAEVSDHVKVLDFGISRFVEASDRTKVGGGLVGTPEYMAPEQVLTPDDVDHRADIYALGVLMYEMLAGRPPFHFGAGASPIKPGPGHKIDIEKTHALLHRIIHEAPPKLDRADAPEGLCEFVVEKLLAKERDNRPSSMTDVQRALDKIGNVPRVSASFAIIADEPPPPSARTRSRDLDPLSDQTLSRAKLDAAELAREVKMLGRRWALVDNMLRLGLFHRKLTSLAAAITQIAIIGDELEHRPRIALDFPKLLVEIKAYSGEGIGVMDLVFAARIEQWLRDNGW